MIPIHQTIIDPDQGNCFPACLASILEIELDQVPHFLKLYGRDEMNQKANEWLEENFGLRLIRVTVDLTRTTTDPDRRFPPLYHYLLRGLNNSLMLVSGESSTYPDRDHVVIGRIINELNEWEMIHDPNPSGKGLAGGKAFHYYFFGLADPVLAKRIGSGRRSIGE